MEFFLMTSMQDFKVFQIKADRFQTLTDQKQEKSLDI